MKRILTLVWAHFRYCLIRIMEFRMEVLLFSIQSVLWALLTFYMMQTVFGQVYAVAGWTRSEALAVVVTCSMFNSLLWWFIYPSMLRFVETIRTGYFDFYLLKPVNPRLLVSISRFEFDNYPRVLVTILLLIGIIIRGSIHVTIASVFLYILLLFIGLIIFYCLFFIVATSCFWFIQLEQLDFLLDVFVTNGRYPSYIFQGGLKIIFFFILPAAFVATLPVQALIGKGGIELVALGSVVAVVFMLFSQWLWNVALRQYSSASS